jgi:hypothetical protein
LACRRQRQRRDIFVEPTGKDFQAPSGAASSIHGKHLHTNLAAKMFGLKIVAIKSK